MNWFGSSKERFTWWSHELVGFRIFDVFDRFRLFLSLQFTLVNEENSGKNSVPKAVGYFVIYL